MNQAQLKRKASARRDKEMRRRSLVAKCEVEEMNLGMMMTKKREGDNLTSDLYGLPELRESKRGWRGRIFSDCQIIGSSRGSTGSLVGDF